MLQPPASILLSSTQPTSSSTMADQGKLSAARVAEFQGSSYVLKVHGYSTVKSALKITEFITSRPFRAGSHNFVVRYYPNGVSAGYASFLLVLESAHSRDMKVKGRFSILGKDGLPVPPHTCVLDNMFPENGARAAYNILQTDLEGSAHIIVDDCLTVRFDITVVKDIPNKAIMASQFVVVPPSDLHRHFGNLLESMVGVDVTFHVGGEKFLAHSSVLAARSPVFKAELHGAMKGNADSPIVIHEMEAVVFKCLLHFIYTDSLPLAEMASDQGVAMAGHLLVAADRYGVERLKLICEHILCSHIDANMVATSLALADQHSCSGLKEACLQFLACPSNLEAMMSSDGYEHLKISCRSALKELIARLLPATMKAAKDIVMTI